MGSSKIFLWIVLFCVCSIVATKRDEDFSEFDDFDQDEFVVETPSATGATTPSSKTQSKKQEPDINDDVPSSKPIETKDEEVTIDDDDDEAMFDEEEFEASDSFQSSKQAVPDLKITEVPANLTGNRWEAYYPEGIMILLLLVYLINFLAGRTKNSSLADTIYRGQQDLLIKNFTLVGDNGQTSSTQSDEPATSMSKESESLYILWCSGRVSVDSMLIELRCVKRQCLFNSLAAIIKSTNDTLVYTIDFSKDVMDTFVFCFARKRCAVRLHREMNDLSQFCAERKNVEKKNRSGNYQIISELGEALNPLIEVKPVSEFIDRFPDAIEYIHISDQYTGTKTQGIDQQPSTTTSTNTGSASQQQDALNTSERFVRRVLIVAFNLVAHNGRSLQVSCESVSTDYLRLVLYLIDRISMFRLTSRDLQQKAVKNRQRIEEQFLKSVNQQRQEQAQQRRERQRREEKENIMKSDDPELQRKWEEKELKREMKRRQPKVKQMKVKAM